MADEQIKEVTTPNPTPSPTPSPTPPPKVELTIEEYQRYRGLETRIADIEREKQAEIDAKEAARLAAIADKEGAQAALDQQRTTLEAKIAEREQKYQKLEQQTLAAERSAVISQALAGRAFAGETAEDQAEAARQLKSILEQDVEVIRDANGKPIAKDRLTGRPADQVIREALEGRKYAHFLARKGGDGTGGGGGDRQSRDQQQDEPLKPGTLNYEIERRKQINAIVGGTRGIRPISSVGA
jgi:hypothetical protein